jgi:hypothetical protein
VQVWPIVEAILPKHLVVLNPFCLVLFDVAT